MTNKYIYNNNLDDIAIHQIAELEQAEGRSYEDPEYARLELDQRTLEIIIDCLEAGMEAYEDNDDNEEVPPVYRIQHVIHFLKSNY